MKSSKSMEKILKEHRHELVKKYRVSEIGIFGSYATGEQHKKSDVDILIGFEELPDLYTLCELERYLEKLLKRKVDLVEKSGLRPRLRERILNQVVYV